MFDYVMERINALIASGAASWNDAIAQLQAALDAGTVAYDAHMGIMNAAYDRGDGEQWADIEYRLSIKLTAIRSLAQAINALTPGEPIHGLGAFVFPPVIAGLSVGAALLLLGGLYVIISEAADFFLKVTGKMPPTSGRVDTLVKYGIIAAALVMLLPQIVGSMKK